MKQSRTLWSPGAAPDDQMLAYTIGDDRELDTRLLGWDILGSLGHVEALAGGGVISDRERSRMRNALKGALTALGRGELRIGTEHEDGHSAVEFWLTQHHGDAGERIHAGRSRNDQVALDLRLFQKDAVLGIHRGAARLASELLAFAAKHRKVIWPGYTHQRIAMPSSAGAWAAGAAEQLLDAIDAVSGIWPRIDRSPLGSAAGYGVPLPLDRERSARALGFAGIDQVVTTVQNARGQLEAAVLAWCLDLAHPMARLSSDVILWSSDEFGWLILPQELSTGSSIMPQKRNPDLFELTRARAAALTGDHATVMALKAGLGGGYHRDFQLLKAPLFSGLDRTAQMVGMLSTAIPRLGVDAVRGRTALRNEVFATDAALYLVDQGVPFRRAYREVAARVKRGEQVAEPSPAALLAKRSSTGGLGNLPLSELKARARHTLHWNARMRQRFDVSLARLVSGRKR
ncbi:MAG TPA: lyase family protein [Gemmatimonadales bacterium]|nr:lyase family protein [Gemmatimonadales bacterium]